MRSMLWPSAAASVATTVSPAPETSNTSRATAPRWATRPSAETSVIPSRLRVTRIAPRRCRAMRSRQVTTMASSVSRLSPAANPSSARLGRQHRGAGVAREVASLGIDHHRSRGALGRLYQLPHQFGRKHALGVIREHDHVAGRECIPGEAKETLGRALGDRVGRLRIGAQKLLTAGNEAGLFGGEPPPLHQQVGLDPLLAPDQAGEPAPHLVVPDHREQSRLRRRARRDCAPRCRRPPSM